MVPEDLLFWIVATDTDTPSDAKLLCRRHADAMVVPRGWTLDDRRQPTPSLFQTRRYDNKASAASMNATLQAAAQSAAAASTRRHVRRAAGQAVEQLQIDGTGPIPRPTPEQLDQIVEPVVEPVVDGGRELHQAVPAHDRNIAILGEPGDRAELTVEAAPAESSDTVAEDGTVAEDDTVEDDTVEDGTVEDGTNFAAWRPEFDTDDDLDGLLETKSPLLSRAFRGIARQR